jgi:hypothetical protein
MGLYIIEVQMRSKEEGHIKKWERLLDGMKGLK